MQILPAPSIGPVSTTPASVISEYPAPGERVMGGFEGMEVAVVAEDQPEVPDSYSIVDQNGGAQVIYLNRGQWWVMDRAGLSLEAVIELEEEESDQDDLHGEKFRAEMDALDLPIEAWHERLESARVQRERASGAADAHRAFLHMTILIEIVNRIDPSYYGGRKRY
jgi:hypothetical protein